MLGQNKKRNKAVLVILLTLAAIVCVAAMTLLPWLSKRPTSLATLQSFCRSVEVNNLSEADTIQLAKQKGLNFRIDKPFQEPGLVEVVVIEGEIDGSPFPKNLAILKFREGKFMGKVIKEVGGAW